MDGNGRWAEARNLPRFEGHRAGAVNLRSIVRRCRERGVKYLTVYAFSKENWQRPLREVKFLFDLFIQFIRTEVPELARQGVALTMIGEGGDLPPGARVALEYAAKKTAHCQDMRLTLAMSYSGREEILRAARLLAQQGVKPEAITEETFRTALYADLPDPDLIIRTSGELRLSNFLLFQSAYSEFYFTPTLWPDFSPQELDQALESYAGRERRFGKLEKEEAKA